jgi:hypothetical protein
MALKTMIDYKKYIDLGGNAGTQLTCFVFRFLFFYPSAKKKNWPKANFFLADLYFSQKGFSL